MVDKSVLKMITVRLEAAIPNSQSSESHIVWYRFMQCADHIFQHIWVKTSVIADLLCQTEADTVNVFVLTGFRQAYLTFSLAYPTMLL